MGLLGSAVLRNGNRNKSNLLSWVWEASNKKTIWNWIKSNIIALVKWLGQSSIEAVSHYENLTQCIIMMHHEQSILRKLQDFRVFVSTQCSYEMGKVEELKAMMHNSLASVPSRALRHIASRGNRVGGGSICIQSCLHTVRVDSHRQNN